MDINSGLIGAGLTALVALAVARVNGRNTRRNDYEKWLKEQRVKAYAEFFAAERTVRAEFGRYYEQHPDGPFSIGEMPPEYREMMLARARSVGEVSLLSSPVVMEMAMEYTLSVAEFVVSHGRKPSQIEMNKLEQKFTDYAREELHGKGVGRFPRWRKASVKSIDSQR